MRLTIDGMAIQAQPGDTLLDLVRKLELDTKQLSTRPLAAKIAGEVFTLNYIPLRDKDGSPERPSMRKAMEASGGKVTLLRYADAAGKEVYQRTAQYILFLALHRLWPNAKAKMNCSVGPGLFIAVSEAEDFSVRALKAEVQKIVDMDIPLIRQRLTTQDAIARYLAAGQEDKARLLQWRSEPYFDAYI